MREGWARSIPLGVPKTDGIPIYGGCGQPVSAPLCRFFTGCTSRPRALIVYLFNDLGGKKDGLSTLSKGITAISGPRQCQKVPFGDIERSGFIGKRHNIRSGLTCSNGAG